jgi:Fe-S-cluster containining protein
MAKLNIASFTRRAGRKKKDLAKFLRKLGKSNKRGIYPAAVQANYEVWQEIECLDCANCCKKMTPTYTPKDIKRIATHLDMTYDEYFEKWLKKDTNGDIINKSTPCQFLGKDHKCTIYEMRPDDCAQFPHFVRKDVKFQIQEKTYTNNLSYCPATLRFVEKLEEAFAAKL